MNTLTITLELGEEKASAIAKAVGLEAGSELMRRSEVSIRADCGVLAVDLRSDDLSGLRASLNTYMRWIIMCDELVEVN
jgi:tRNA threonylcarbamoyladenosine modification (KEOPS) complex  Pcc1 subunit